MRFNAILLITLLTIFFLFNINVLFANTNDQLCDNLSLLLVAPQDECNYANFYFNGNISEINTDCFPNEPDTIFKVVVPENGQFLVTANRMALSLYTNCTENNIICETIFSSELISNLPPNDTLFARFTPYFSSATEEFRVCFSEANTSENATCENATFAPVGYENDCLIGNTIKTNVTHNTVNILPECPIAVSFDFDVYFEFTAPPNGYVKIVSEEDLYMSIYDNCVSNLVICGFQENTVVPQLTPGETYILQVFGRFSNEFDLCIFEVEPQVNNTCENAVFVNVATNNNCETVSFEFNNINNSLDINTSCDSFNTSDSFYKFVVPPSGHVTLLGEFYSAWAALYNSCNEESIFCDFITWDTGISNLTPGDTLILQLIENYERVYNTCIVEVSPSPNDDCENATEFTIGSEEECLVNQISYVTIYNKEEDFSFDDCSRYYRDAYYAFTTPASGYVSIKSNHSTHAEILNNCDGLIEQCVGISDNYVIPYTTPGTENLLRVDVDIDTFELCIFEITPTFNNNCENAELIYPLPLNSCNNDTIAVDMTFNTSEIIPPCSSNRPPSKDIFYKFVVPEGGQIEIDFDTNVNFSIYDSCNGNSLHCGTTTFGTTIDDLPVGDTLILQLFPLNELIADVCVIAILPSSNNTCSTPTNLSIYNAEECTNNKFVQYVGNNIVDLEQNCFNNIYRDAFFEFTAPISGSVRVNSNSDLLIYNGCEDVNPTCLDSGSIMPSLEPGNTYIIQSVLNYNTDTLKICLTSIQPSNNDSCENATVLNTYPLDNCENLVEVDLSQNSLDILPSCRPNMEADAFFEFTAPSSGQVVLSLSTSDAGLAIYESCNLQSILCVFGEIDGYLIGDLAPGNQYVLQIFKQEVQSTFNICLEEATPTVNDLCENAVLLEVEEVCTGSDDYFDITYNTIENQPSCRSADNDAYFKFIVPANGYVRINDYSNSGSYGYALYNACNGSLLKCDSSFDNNIIGSLSPGSLVVLQIFNISNSTEFSLCLSQVSPSENNLCENALPFPLAEQGNCSVMEIPVQISNNTLNFNVCSSYALADVFYYFTAPPTGNVNITLQGNSAEFALYDSCENSNDIIECGKNEFVKGLTPEQTYILQLYSRNEDLIAACVEIIEPTENNFCESALPLTVQDFENCSSNSVLQNLEYNSSITGVCRDGTFQSNAFYQFEAPPSGAVDIEINTLYNYFDVAVYESCDAEPILCLDDLREESITGLIPGLTYYIQLLTSNNFNEVEFCLFEVNPSPNQNCEDAILLNVEELGLCTGNFLDLSFNNLQYNLPCNSDFTADAYYKFVVPASGMVRYFASEENAGFALYESCGDNSLICRSYSNILIIDDLPPNDTLLLQIAVDKTRSHDTDAAFEFCLEEIRPSINNTCNEALELTVGGVENCTQNFVEVNTTYNTAEFAATCGEGVDAFYEFTAPESGYVKLISDATFGVTLYPACDISEVYCLTYAQNAVLPYLSPGEKYIFRLFKMYITQPDFNPLGICLVKVTPGENDNCQDPVLINVTDENDNCEDNYMQVDNFNNPLDLPSIKGNSDYNYFVPECFDEANTDAIFKFVVPQSGQFKINVTTTDLGAAFYDNCENAYLECKRNDLTDHIFRNFVPGDTIILQLFQTNGSSFEFCVQHAPPTINNTCENAILIDISNGQYCNEELDISSNTFNIESCNNGKFINAKDMYFKFVAPESGAIRIDGAFYYGLYEDGCTELIRCAYDEQISFYALSSLSPGETYVIQVFNNSVCIEAIYPPENNVCENAIFLNTGECADFDLNEFTLNKLHSCSSNHFDVFYKIVVSENGEILLSTSPRTGLAIFENCSGNQLYCNKYPYTGVYGDLPPNDTILIQLFEANRFESTLCLDPIPYSVNNTCENAIHLSINEGPKSCLPNATSINGEYNTNNLAVNCTALKDAFYTFTFPENGFVKMDANRSFGAALYDDCEGDFIWCRETNTEDFVIAGLAAGETYLLQIFDFSNYDFALCLTNVQPSINNSCSEAIPVDVFAQDNCSSDVYIEVLLDGNTLNLYPACDRILNTVTADAYYKFIVPQSGQVKIITENKNAGIAIYDACSDSILYCVEFDYDDVIKGLPANEDVILQFFSISVNNFNFCIEDAPALPNNTYENAILVVPNGPEVCPVYTNYVNLSANNLSKAPDCDENATVDIFYKTIVPQNGELQIYTEYFTGLEVYNTLNETAIYCDPSSSDHLLINLVPNDTLILHFFDREYNGSHLSFCLEETVNPFLTPSLNNNYCADDASLLHINEPFSCDSIYRLNLAANVLTETSACALNAEADAFYKIIIPLSGRLKISANNAESVELFNECNNKIACLKDLNGGIIENLAPGETVILRLLVEQINSVDLCLQDAILNENNSCDKAILIPVNENDSNIINKIEVENRANTLQLANECNISAEADVFYKFVVPSSGLIQYNDDDWVYLSIYSNCSESPIYCVDGRDNVPTVFELNPGDTMVLQLSQRYSSNFEFSLVEAEGLNNHNCQSALPVSIQQAENCYENQIEASVQSYSLSLQNECESNSIYNAYYSFFLPENLAFQILANNNFIGVAFYDGCNGQLLSCSEAFIGNIFNLAANENIIMRFFSDNDFYMNFCLVEYNSETDNRICDDNNPLLEVYTTCTNNYTLGNLTTSSNFSNSCSSLWDEDVFYEFVVPPSGNISIISDYTLGVGIHENKSCSSETLFCEDRGTDQVILSLPPGDTLKIEIFGYENQFFNFCIEDAGAVSNDKPITLENGCQQAQLVELIESETCDFYPIQLNGQYYTLHETPFCEDAILDAYYQLTIPENGQLRFITSNLNFKIEVYDACTGETLYCQEEVGFNFLINNLPPATDAIIKIFSDERYTVEICFEKAPSSVNNFCNNATPIILTDIWCIDTIGVNNYNNEATIESSCGESKVDAFYEFLVPSSGAILIESKAYLSASLYNACKGDELYCGEGRYIYINDLPLNESVILQLQQITPSNFEVCITNSATTENNSCSNAVNLEIVSDCNSETIPVSLLENTMNGEMNCNVGCADAYFNFMVPNSGRVKISTLNREGSFVTASIYNNCGGNLIACEALYSTLFENLPAGETVTLQLYQEEAGRFDLCIIDAPKSANNTCANAQFIEILQPEMCNGNFVEALNAFNNIDKETSCFSSAETDIFYKFVVPASGKIKLVEEDFSFALYENCNAEAIFCGEISDGDHLENLPDGDTLILQIVQLYADNFNFCLQDPQPTINNICEQAITIDARNNTIYEEAEYHYVFMSQNEVSGDNSCYESEADIYYKLLVPASGAIEFSLDVNYYNYPNLSIYDYCSGEELYCGEPYQHYNLPDSVILKFSYRYANDFKMRVNALPPADVEEGTPPSAGSFNCNE